MPLITGGTLRPPAGAPTTPGGQGWVDFWRNQFAGAPRYPVRAAGVVPTGNRLTNYRAGLPQGTYAPPAGALDSPLANVPRRLSAVRGTGLSTYANPYGPGQFMFGTGLPAGLNLSPIQFRRDGLPATPGTTPGVPPPTTDVGGPPAYIGPGDYQRYLLGFMRGYLGS